MTSFKKGTIYLENTRAIISKHAYKGERKNCYFRPEQFKDRTLELPSTCNGIFFCGKNMSSSRLYLIPGSLINQTLSRPMGNQGPH